MGFNVKLRKRELIEENVKKVPMAARGELLARIFILSMFFARSFLLLFEIIYTASSETVISVWSHVLFIPFILVIYMIYDGNKSFVYIPLVSAPVRLIYHFTAVLPTVTAEGVSALTIITLIVLALQFFASIVMSVNTRCDVYFTARQKVNIKLRSEMIGGKK